MPASRSQRIAILGAGGRYRTPAAIARGCQALGHHARVFDVLGWARRIGPLAAPVLRRRIEAFAADVVILTVDASALGGDLLETLAHRTTTVFWHFDAQYPPTPKAAWMARIAPVVYTTYLPLVTEFRKLGAAEARFLPQGVDPEIDRPATEVRAAFRCDVVFIGSGQYPSREPILRAVAGAARLQIRGPGWRGAPKDLPVAGGRVLGPGFAEAVCGAAITLGAHALPEQAHLRASASNRMWKVFGCGGFFLGPWVQDIEHFARGGEHCAWYRTVAEAVEQVRHYLGRPEERARLAATARAHALTHHTYAHRVALLLADRGYTGV
jgi:hypothetical protein